MKISFFEMVKRINKLNLLHRIHINRQSTKNGLYLGQLPILEYIGQHDKCTQCQVAEFMHVSQPSIATSIKRMQKNGLLEKTMDESDLRYNRIKITEKGSEIARNCRKDCDKVDQQLFSGFSEEELRALYGYFERMINNLSTEEFENVTFFSLIAEAKKMHAEQHKEGMTQ